MVIDYLKLGVAALAGALLVSGPVYLAGRSDGKDAGRLEAAKEAGQRITQMEKNNAEFNGTKPIISFAYDNGWEVLTVH